MESGIGTMRLRFDRSESPKYRAVCHCMYGYNQSIARRPSVVQHGDLNKSNQQPSYSVLIGRLHYTKLVIGTVGVIAKCEVTICRYTLRCSNAKCGGVCAHRPLAIHHAKNCVCVSVLMPNPQCDSTAITTSRAGKSPGLQMLVRYDSHALNHITNS